MWPNKLERLSLLLDLGGTNVLA
jgi:hypothetical protein